MKISVIVTVHNAEKYLRECIDNVISQTFPEIEILCMDGGSLDESPQILKEYAAKDHRIRIINDTDTSYGHKVNRGIREARGEYVSVLESDDMYMPDMLEQLYEIVSRYRPDYVNADYLEFRDIGGRRYQTPVKMYPEQDYGYLLESGRHPEDMRQILRYWTGLFSRDFLIRKGIWMNESPGASFQDMSFRFLTSALADTCYHLDRLVYLYRCDNPGSSIYDPKKAVVIADEFEFLHRELEKRNIRNTHIWRHFYTWKYNDFYGNLIRFEGAARKELFERCLRDLDTDRIYLEKHGGQGYSQALSDVLSKNREQHWKEIEIGYEKRRKEEIHREQIWLQARNHDIVIFGCGLRGKNALKLLYSLREQIVCFVDNNASLWRTQMDGYPILSPTEAVKVYPNALYLVTSRLYAEEMKKQLLQQRVSEDRIVVL